MRRLVVIGSLLTLFVASMSCGEAIDVREKEVRAAIARTKRLSRSFVYTERTLTDESTVRGIVQDDYRYKAQLSVQGTAAIEEVAVDDALAVRFLDLERAGDLLAGPTRSPASRAVDPAARAAPGGREVDALLARRWVVDPYGAPELVVTRAGVTRVIGADPVLDGLTVFAYVERALAEAASVFRFNKESSAYNVDEDPFPVPDEDTGVTRYDTEAPPLPRPSRSGAAAAQGAPQTSHFRRMAVYVKDGRVLEVREAVAPTRRQLEHLEEFYEIDVQTEDVEQAGVAAIDALNRLRLGAGEQQIRMRTMSLELHDLGRARAVALPGEAVTGNLSILSNRGRNR
jgi:hypothetical protein